MDIRVFDGKRNPDNVFDPDLLDENLAVGRHLLDAADDGHALDDPAEGGVSLAVRVPPAAEIHLGLVVDADEKFGAGRPGFSPGQGKRAVFVQDSGHGRGLMRDGRQTLGPDIQPESGLDEFDFDKRIRLVIGFEYPVESRSFITVLVYVAEEVGRGDGSLALEYFGFDVPELGLDKDQGVLPGPVSPCRPRKKNKTRAENKSRFIHGEFPLVLFFGISPARFISPDRPYFPAAPCLTLYFSNQAMR